MSTHKLHNPIWFVKKTAFLVVLSLGPLSCTLPSQDKPSTKPKQGTPIKSKTLSSKKTLLAICLLASASIALAYKNSYCQQEGSLPQEQPFNSHQPSFDTMQQGGDKAPCEGDTPHPIERINHQKIINLLTKRQFKRQEIIAQKKQRK